MSDKLNEIYNLIYVDKTENSQSINLLIEPEIDNFMKMDDSEYDDFYKATCLISEYGVGLYNKGYLKKAKPFIEKGIQNIECDYKQKDKDFFKDELYCELIWIRGLIYHNFKKYRLAGRDFKALYEHFPQNDRYKNWYNSSNNFVINKIEWLFIGIMIGCNFIGVKNNLFFYIGLAALIGLIASLIYKFFTRIK